MNSEQKNPTILLVDEDRFLLGIYAKRLNDNSWNTEFALSADEAVQKMTKSNFDVVLLDVVVGQLPGVEILRSLKEKNLRGKVATIILSNNDNNEDVENARVLGADGYIVKAHNTPAEVVEEIERIYKSNLTKRTK